MGFFHQAALGRAVIPLLQQLDGAADLRRFFVLRVAFKQLFQQLLRFQDFPFFTECPRC